MQSTGNNSPAPVASENAEQSPKLSPLQLFRRRQWANLLCRNAANETSRAMARRLCQSWFPTCRCERNQEN